VLGENREALPGVRVSAGPRDERPRFVPREEAARREGVTDARGRFVVRNARGGEFDVTFDHPEHQMRRVPVSARAGEHDMGEVVLDRGPGIEGVVVDAEGAPQDGVRVLATWMREPGGAVAADPELGRTWAQGLTEAGRFAFHGLREGRYRIQPQRDGWFGDRPVVATGSRDLRITMRPAADLRGRVLGGGAPVAGAFVRATLGGEGAGGYVAGARTAEDGTFVLAGLPPDEPFDLAVTHQDYQELRVRGIRATSERRDFALDAGVGFAGVVVEPDGTPVPNATVQVLSGGRSVKFERADAKGRFDVSGLPEGVFEARVSWTSIGHVQRPPLAVRPGDRDVRLVVERGERISGKVVWKGAGSATPLRVEAVGPDGEAVAQVWVWPQNPAFELEGLPRGSYAVRVSRGDADRTFTVVAEVAGVASGTRDLLVEAPG
jgi:hypothetical protein